MKVNFEFKKVKLNVESEDSIHILQGARWKKLKLVVRANGKKYARIIDGENAEWILVSKLMEKYEAYWRKKKLEFEARILRNRKKIDREKALKPGVAEEMCLRICEVGCRATMSENKSSVSSSGYKGVRVESGGRYSVIAMGKYVNSYPCRLEANKISCQVQEYMLENSEVKFEDICAAFGRK